MCGKEDIGLNGYYQERQPSVVVANNRISTGIRARLPVFTERRYKRGGR